MQIVDAWLRDMPQQFLGQDKIEVLISAFARQLQEVQQVLDDLVDKTDLETAEGKNLDNVGTIIPLSRKEAGILAGADAPEYVISDDRYRKFLKYQRLVNTNECTYYDLMDGLALLWDVSPIWYIEDPALPATIILTMPFLKPGGEAVELGEVPMVKPAGVQIEFQYIVKIVVETIVQWIYKVYQVPLCNQILCGQWPRPGSLGEFVYIESDVGLNEIMSVFDETLAGTIVIGGRAYDSTTGEIITEGVEITLDSDCRIHEVNIAGKTISGVVPTQAVNGVFIGSSVEANSSVGNGFAALSLAGSITAGGGELEAAELALVNDDVSADATVHIAAATVRSCGAVSCGNM